MKSKILAPALFVMLTQTWAASAAELAPAPDTVALVAANSHAFTYTESALDGPGADLLLSQMKNAQFVLFGEEHMDHSIPVFAGALYTTLNQRFGFTHLVVEQDPVAITDVLDPRRRGDVNRIAAHARDYPSLYEFDTDEDLALLARAGTLVKGPDAIWGVEQSVGAVRYLEELLTLAPNEAQRARIQEMLADARAADHEPKYSVNWLVAKDTTPALTALKTLYQSSSGSRAYRLIEGLEKSSEIFGYYRRAEAGEFVGLYNNTVREEVLKGNFLERYRAVARREGLPKAMFKFGANHLYHGRNPTNAHPIGNLAHELAIFNGREAFGVYVMPLGPNYMSYADFPPWMLPLLPAQEPTAPTLIDLQALRPYQRLFREKVAEADRWMLRDLINGYQAIVLLPGSMPGSRKLGGR